MRARHHHALPGAAGGLRDHVLRLPPLGSRLDGELDSVPRGEPRAGAHDQGRYAGADAAERGSRHLSPFVVANEHGAGAGPLGVLRLHSEEAVAAHGERDLAVLESAKVGTPQPFPTLTARPATRPEPE